jgi:UDP:flavonoid glycosyltransferase YjiC (YdhE family)
MGNYLIVTWDGAGNLVSTLGIARRLVERGHGVRLLGHPSIDERCGSHGWRFVPFSATTAFDNTDEADPGDEIARLSRTLWCSPAVGEDVLRELEREPADVVMADCMLFGALSAAQATGVPTVALFHSPYSLFRGGPLADMLAPGLAHLTELRASLGLGPAASLSEVHDACSACLVATPREFDVDIPVPDDVRFVGPVLDGPPLSAEVDDLRLPRGDDPLVLVSFSTSFQGQLDALQRVADGLGQLPVRAVVSTGPAIDPAAIMAAGNTEVVRFVPHRQVLPEASLVVTHAGLGTVLTGLAHGVPLVCVPMGRDQFFNAAMVERLGVGSVVDPGADARAFAAAVADALASKEMAAAAGVFARVIAGYGGASAAVAALEDLHEAGRTHEEVSR